MTLSYHDLHITTESIPRTSIFNLPYGLEVHCSRVAGWQLWKSATRPEDWELLAGEYEGPEKWLVLDVAGEIILDSRDQEREPGGKPS